METEGLYRLLDEGSEGDNLATLPGDAASPGRYWHLKKEFRFEAAHKLSQHDGQCARLHGHSFVAVVHVRSDLLVEGGPKDGMVIDYSDIKKHLKPLIDEYLDHHYLNETLQMEAPTSERVAQWIYDRLQESGLPGLFAVEVKETCTASCLYVRAAY